MRQDLQVGLHGLRPGWQELMTQLGVDWDIAPLWRGIRPEEFAVLVISASLSRRERENLRQWIHAGGTALLCGSSDLSGERVIRLDYDPGARLENLRARHGYFNTVTRDLQPAERVGIVDKGAATADVRRALTRLYHARQLPFICKGGTPRGSSAVLLFRVDSDYGTRPQIEALARDLRDQGIPASWFLHVEAHLDWLAELVPMLAESGAEIGLHCFRHRTFATRLENQRNVDAALEALQVHGVSPIGFAAPNGIWNHELGDVLDDAGFAYSSEFGIGWESLPFRPPLRRRDRVNSLTHDVLQIPVHPISPGNLRRERFDEDEGREHYRLAAERMIARDVPVAFYTHPHHSSLHLFQDGIVTARDAGARFMTFAEYSSWWDHRRQMSFRAAVSAGAVEAFIWNDAADVCLEAVLPNGRTEVLSPGVNRMPAVDLTSEEELDLEAEMTASPLDGRRDPRLRRHALFDRITRLSR